MKTCIKIALYSILAAIAASASESPALVSQLKDALPAEWELVNIVPNDVPAWSRRGLACTKIVLAGPRKSGYRYYDKAGALLAEHFSEREAILVWVADPAFDMGWSLSDSIRNRFSKVPVARPVLLHDQAVRVFALEDLFSIDSTYAKVSPPGTAFARSIPFARSWPEWERSLRAALQALKKPKSGARATPLSARRGHRLSRRRGLPALPVLERAGSLRRMKKSPVAVT